MQGEGVREEPGEDMELLLGRFVCHVLKQLTALLVSSRVCWSHSLGQWALAVSQGVFRAGLVGGGYRAGSIVSLKRFEKKCLFSLLFPTWI